MCWPQMVNRILGHVFIDLLVYFSQVSSATVLDASNFTESLSFEFNATGISIPCWYPISVSVAPCSHGETRVDVSREITGACRESCSTASFSSDSWALASSGSMLVLLLRLFRTLAVQRFMRAYLYGMASLMGNWMSFLSSPY